MEDKLKVLHIASWYPSAVSLQNGNFIQRHIEAISQYTENYVLHTVADDVEKNVYDISRKPNLTEYVLRYPRVAKPFRLFKYIQAHEQGFQRLSGDAPSFDLVHQHVLMPSIFFGNKIAKRYDIPLVATEHATAFQPTNPNKYSGLEKWYLKRKSKHISLCSPVSKDLQQKMQNFGIRIPFQVIDNVVDTEIFHPGYSNEKSTATFEFLHVSSLNDPHKNVTGIIQAFYLYLKFAGNGKLTIIGNDYHTIHQAFVDELGIGENVEIHKAKDTSNIARRMCAADVLVMFSNYENAPCVISEAHCTGTPVISTDVGGIVDMIDETNGVLVKPNNINELTEAMLKLTSNLSRYSREMIASTASARYGKATVGKKYLELYRSALNIH